MYTLYIADDEKNTREGLKTLFDWAKYHVQIVGDAADGSVALPEIIRLKPDILLTDIKMPIMSGIALAEEVRKHCADIKIVFISGYDDIDYMKSALKLEAIDYIFKPVEFEELENTVIKVIERLETEKEKAQLINDMDARLTRSLPLLRDRFFVSLVKGGFKKQEQIERQAEFLGIGFPHSRYCVLAVSIDDYMLMCGAISERDRQLLSFGILNIMQELIDKAYTGYAFETAPGEYTALLSLDDAYAGDSIYNFAGGINQKLLKYLEVSTTIGIGSEAASLLHVKHSYDSAADAVKLKLHLGKSNIITADILKQKETPEEDAELKLLGDVEALLRAGDKSGLWTYIEQYFASIHRRRNIEYYQNICLQLLTLSHRILMELDVKVTEREYTQSSMVSTLFKLETIEDMKGFLTDYFRKISGHIIEKRQNKSRRVIDQMKDMIAQRYYENITINQIAAQVFLTPTYVCLLFRQETGETVNDYLTRVRMEKAKEMLKEPQARLYDICYAVGYANPSYFSKQFKKYTGLGPREYRDKMV